MNVLKDGYEEGQPKMDLREPFIWREGMKGDCIFNKGKLKKTLLKLQGEDDIDDDVDDVVFEDTLSESRFGALTLFV